jgi:hypothetical protein
LRARLRSRCRLAHIFSTAAWPSARTRAASPGWTSSTRSPAATSITTPENPDLRP